ncbi:MAG: 5'-3' exonuclease H3TH domain-containing protein, partial [Patescibacteria group bacterium]
MKAKKDKKKRLILLDSHAIIHRAYHALPEFSASSTGEPTGALYGLVAMLIKMIQDLKPDYIVAAFDLSGPTYRHQAYDQYKAGRKENDQELELQLKRSYDIFESFNIPVYSHEGFEADDIIGTIVHKFKKNKDMDIIIASGDMDTMQLVDDKKVQVYTLKKGINDTILYDEDRVLERFGFLPEKLIDYKGLRGDPSDNIIGVKGIGEKTATSLISAFGTVEQIYKVLKKGGPRLAEALAKAGITERVKNLLIENEEEALFSKTLATIRTDAPIDFRLPEEWAPNFNLEKVLDLFKTLGFRTLSDRVKQMARKLGQETDSGQKTALSSSAEDARSTPADAVRDAFLPQNQVPLEFSPQEAKELSLMLWIIDSNITAPTLEDVFNFTKTNDIKEARKFLEEEMDKRKVRNVFEDIEKPLMPIVEKMNERGVKVDKEVLQNLSQTYHKELSRLEKAIWKEAGEEFNINSPKVLS